MLKRGDFYFLSFLFPQPLEHYFELPVNCGGKDQNLKGRLVTFGYDYTFHIVVEGEEIVFEKDGLGDFQAASNTTKISGKVSITLLAAIVQSLRQLTLR